MIKSILKHENKQEGNNECSVFIFLHGNHQSTLSTKWKWENHNPFVNGYTFGMAHCAQAMKSYKTDQF